MTNPNTGAVSISLYSSIKSSYIHNTYIIHPRAKEESPVMATPAAEGKRAVDKDFCTNVRAVLLMILACQDFDE